MALLLPKRSSAQTTTYPPNPTYAVAPKGASGNPNPAHSETTKLMQPRPQRSGAKAEQAARRGDHLKTSLFAEAFSPRREKAGVRCALTKHDAINLKQPPNQTPTFVTSPKNKKRNEASPHRFRFVLLFVFKLLQVKSSPPNIKDP